MILRCIFLSVFFLGLAACGDEKPENKSAFSLKTVQLEISGHRVEAEVAASSQTMATGLMYRKSMGKDHGMIFIFQSERQASFWMHNTHIPLDIAYLDRHGKILEVHAAMPLDDTPISSATKNVAYALELNQGWFVNKGIPPGVVVRGLPAFPPAP